MKKRTNVVLTAVLVFAVCAFVGMFGKSQAATILTEGFEAGGKTAYAAANVTLGTGSWLLDDALTGNSTSDRKTGSWSARVRNVGKVRMNFNVASTGTVSVAHAKYGTDANSTWELWRSTNNGSTWTKVGATVTTSTTSLVTATFTVNSTVASRYEIRKISGGTNRINFDTVAITDFVTATPTPTPTITPTPTPPPPSSNVNLTMGNPSVAATNVAFTTNYLMEKPQFVMSYHRDNGRPNWVSWHLDTSWLGTTPRQDSFRNDTSLPAGWYQVLGTDYSGSGYDRGHMCPSADRTTSVANNDATFLMTNMIPQAPTNNQTTWANLESYCRTLANAGNELYIISGGHGNSGFIANGRVAIPTTTWKVIMVIPNGTNDVSRVTTGTRLIAVSMPNNNNVVSDWRTYRVSVDSVEALTGYDFFSNVSPAIQSVIESTIDNQLIEDWEMVPDQAAIEENRASSPDGPVKEKRK